MFVQHDEHHLSLRVYGGIMCLLSSLYCTVGSVVYIYLVQVRGSAGRSTEFSLLFQLGAIDCKLGMASYGHGDAWICIRVFRERCSKW